MATVVFSMSEGQAERFPDWESRTLTVETEGSIHLVFEYLHDQDANVLAVFDGSYWTAIADHREYSDVGIVADDGTPPEAAPASPRQI